jgi:hypothetical protein
MEDHSDLYIIIPVCKANATMFVVKYHSRSILHAQLDWHRGNIHCSYFLVFLRNHCWWFEREQLNITEKVKECKKTVYSDYNVYSCRLAEEESKHLLIPFNFILVCKANATMFVVKYHSRSILHAQLDWHRGNIHCSYFLVFLRNYNLYSYRLAEEESKHLLIPCNVNIL